MEALYIFTAKEKEILNLLLNSKNQCLSSKEMPFSTHNVEIEELEKNGIIKVHIAAPSLHAYMFSHHYLIDTIKKFM